MGVGGYQAYATDGSCQRGRQRSIVGLVAMFLTVMASLIVGLFVIGEGLSGA